MKKIISTILILLIILTSCSGNNESTKEPFSKVYYGPDNNIQVFDTAIVLMAFTDSEEDFNKYYDLMGEEFLKYHKLFDRYNTYEGINNVKTINDNAGIKPVEVEDPLYDVIDLALSNYDKTLGKNNIGMGNIIDIWSETMTNVVNYKHDKKEELEREENIEVDEDEIEIPSDLLPNKGLLEEKASFADINNIVLDKEKKTVYIRDNNMTLDLGAVGKGFATELVAKKLEEEGLDSAIISAGGNVRTIGNTKRENKKHWAIGIAHPRPSEINETIETLYVDQTSIVTSGDYQRYFMANNERYHHIIDPDTMYPSKEFSSVTIVTEDSGLADYLSTVLFIVDEKEGREIISKYDEDIQVLWVDLDGKVTYTEGLEKMMKSKGFDNEK